MAITVNWGTKVISVEKVDSTQLQPSPEVRELDIDVFRLALKDLEDDEEGMAFPDTHSHITEVLLSGITYARFVEIINGYTVEFEDGQYTISCVGANHNLGDVKVANQVSLIINNAAGLIYPGDFNVEYIAGAIWDEPVSTHVESGSFGEKVGKKLLTVAKFIGLK